jgi:hypothetical protein
VACDLLIPTNVFLGQYTHTKMTIIDKSWKKADPSAPRSSQIIWRSGSFVDAHVPCLGRCLGRYYATKISGDSDKISQIDFDTGS